MSMRVLKLYLLNCVLGNLTLAELSNESIGSLLNITAIKLLLSFIQEWSNVADLFTGLLDSG